MNQGDEDKQSEIKKEESEKEEAKTEDKTDVSAISSSASISSQVRAVKQVDIESESDLKSHQQLLQHQQSSEDKPPALRYQYSDETLKFTESLISKDRSSVSSSSKREGGSELGKGNYKSMRSNQSSPRVDNGSLQAVGSTSPRGSNLLFIDGEADSLELMKSVEKAKKVQLTTTTPNRSSNDLNVSSASATEPMLPTPGKNAAGIAAAAPPPTQAAPLQGNPVAKANIWKSLMRIDNDEGEYYEVLPNPMLGNLKMPHPREILDARLRDLIRTDFETTINEFYEDGETCTRCKLWFLKDIIDAYASFRIFFYSMWTFEFATTLILAVGSTCFFSYYTEPDGGYLASKLDFNIIGSAFVFPVTFLISQTFTRRQGALNQFAQFKALICNLGMGLLNWNWPDLAGRKKLPPTWEHDVHEALIVIAAETVLLLKLPTWNRNRHLMTRRGRKFRKNLLLQQRAILQSVTQTFLFLSWFVEDLKQIGLPANEASRLNQYVSMMQTCFEKLVQVKNYRTPMVSRSFVRIFILIVPIFYGPYFAWVAGRNGQQTNIGFAIALTIVMILILLGLVTVQRAFEDPFLAQKGDDIDLEHEYRDICDRLARIHSLSKEEQYLRTGRPYQPDQDEVPSTIHDGQT